MKRTTVVLVGVCLAMSTAAAWAQGPGGPGGGFGGPGGGRFGRGGGRMSSLLGLLRVEAVQNEIDLVDDQKGEIDKLNESMRGEGGRGGGPGGGDRPDFQNMTDEERETFMAERRKQAEARNAKEKEELGKILLESQMKRLNEISIQVRGAEALSDAEVATALAITDEQKKQLEEVQNEVREGMREQMAALRDAGDEDPEAMRTKMTELRKQNEEKVLAVLSETQREQFAAMKGEAFEMPADAMFGGRGGFGGGRGGRGGGRGGDRPQRPE